MVSENTCSETASNGVRVAYEAFLLVVSNSEIELLGPVSSVFEASVRSLSALFGQFLSAVGSTHVDYKSDLLAEL
jgi:hypothetical protein